MNYYPVFLTIAGKKCVVIGGGEVAERKVQKLLDCGASVSVVDRQLTPLLQVMEREGKISHIAEEYCDLHIEGAALVIGATDSEEVNRRISADARARGIWVNIVDAPALCDFILPAVVDRGDLSIAVSTSGKSPAMARKIREDLENLYGAEYACLFNIMGELRNRVLGRGDGPEENKKIFDALVNSEMLSFIRKKDCRGLRDLISRITGIDMEVDI